MTSEKPSKKPLIPRLLMEMMQAVARPQPPSPELMAVTEDPKVRRDKNRRVKNSFNRLGRRRQKK